MTRLSLLVVFTSLLLACGWQLRGVAELPPALQTLKVDFDRPGSGLNRSLLRSLEVAGIDVDSGATDNYRLILRNENSFSREVSVDRRARSAEREMVLSVVVTVADPDGEPIHGPINLSGGRIYSYDPNNVIAKQDEERLLGRELRDDLGAQILHILRAAGRRIPASSTP